MQQLCRSLTPLLDTMAKVMLGGEPYSARSKGAGQSRAYRSRTVGEYVARHRKHCEGKAPLLTLA